MSAQNLHKSNAQWKRVQTRNGKRAFMNRTDARIFTGRTSLDGKSESK
jgi:hypothetical protein